MSHTSDGKVTSALQDDNSSLDVLEAKLQQVRELKKKSISTTQSSAAPPSISPSASHPSYEPTDVIQQEYRFIRSEQDDEEAQHSWEKKVAKSYSDSLYKEFALADMSRYKEGKLGLRWRLEKEVKSGKGERICGNKACSNTQSLSQYEVPFGYKEAGQDKLALVKLTMCPECALKLQNCGDHHKLGETANPKKRHMDDEESSGNHYDGAGPSDSKKSKR